MTDTIYILLMCAAILIVIGVFSKKHRRENEFDERQKHVRGRAYKYGFFTLLIAQSVCLICDSVFDLELMFFFHCLCLFSGLTIFAVYCVWNDAFLSFRQSPSSYLFICAIIIIANSAGIVSRALDGIVISEWINTSYCLNFLCSLTFVIITITMTIKIFVNRKDME